MRSRRGVTLMEIALVVAMIGILASIGASMLTKQIPTWRTRRAAKEFLAHVNAARAMAIADGVEYRILIEATEDDPTDSTDAAGAYRVQQGNAASESTEWDTLPVEVGSGDDIGGEGYVNIATGMEDSLPGVTIKTLDPPLFGPSHGGSADAIHFGPSGMVLNDGDDFGDDGFIYVRFVNKKQALEGVDEVLVVSIARGGLARMVGGDNTIGYSAGSGSTTANAGSGSGYSGGSSGSETPI